MTTMTNPVWDQQQFRIRNDDGTESTATWKAATNTNVNLFRDALFRVRLTIADTATANQNNTPTFKLRYSRNGGAYTDVAAQGATSDAVRYANGQPADNAATTQQISSGTFVAGRYAEQATHTALSAISNAKTEMEWAIEIVSSVANRGDTITLRAYLTSNTALDVYTQTPSIVVLANVTTIADPGAYSWTGTAAATLHNRVMVADSGSYAWTGTDATTRKEIILTADPGAFAWTGTDAALLYSRVMVADAGSFSWSGTDASLLHNRLLSAEAGSFSWTGTDVTTSVGGEPVVAEQPVAVGGGKRTRNKRRFLTEFDGRKYEFDSLQALVEFVGRQKKRPVTENKREPASRVATISLPELAEFPPISIDIDSPDFTKIRQAMVWSDFIGATELSERARQRKEDDELLLLM